MGVRSGERLKVRGGPAEGNAKLSAFFWVYCACFVKIVCH
jgi:hypothetical protein